MKKRKLLLILAVALMANINVLFANGNQEAKQKIVFGDLTWDSALIHNRIAAFIIENGIGGYDIEYTSGGTIPIVQGVITGDIDINMESWHSNFNEVYNKGVESGDLIDLGKNLPDAPQGWYIPSYLVEGDNPIAPELKSVEDLKKYPELFPDPEDDTKGIIYGGAAGWGQLELSQELFDSSGLEDYYNFMVPGSGASLNASLVGQYERKEPWVGYYWEPSTILGKLDMVRLKGSEYPPADINILVNKSMIDKAPEVVSFLKNYSTTVKQNNEFLAYKDDNELTTNETAIWFLRNYEDVWTKWVPTDVAEKVKSALKKI